MEYKSTARELMEFFPVTPGDEATYVPEPYRDRILVDVIHDGEVIPSEFMVDAGGDPVEYSQFMQHFVAERDWGANMVAGQLAAALGLKGYWSVNIARVLLDFGRFPGSSQKHAEHLERFAINYPFSELLGYEQKKRLLEQYYDVISATYDGQVTGKLLKLAVHTYDTYNRNGTRRPRISLISRTRGHEFDSDHPESVFDPLYPHALGEFTANRALAARVALTVEKHGYPCGSNFPYLLPEGSIEVRSQVWLFFRMLRQRFEELRPESIDTPAYLRTWAMLEDTNLRSSESEQLRSYLHLFRKAPRGLEDEFRAARVAYEEIQGFLEADGRRLVDDYRFSRDRPSALGIEIRKDLLFDFDSHGRPIRPKPEAAREVAAILAEGICTFLREDRDEVMTSELSWGVQGPPQPGPRR